MTQPNQSELDEILAKHGAEAGELTHSLKQAIKQLIADEMRELIGDDLRPLPNGYMPESHEEVNNTLAIQRTKLAEWLKEVK